MTGDYLAMDGVTVNHGGPPISERLRSTSCRPRAAVAEGGSPSAPSRASCATVPNGATVVGSPASPIVEAKRQWVATAQLPGMVRRLRDLEKWVKAFKKRCAGTGVLRWTSDLD